MNGAVHFRANVAAGAALTVAALAYRPEVAWPLAIGCAVGTFVTPDLDLESRTYTEHLLWQIPPLGFAFQIAFYPYALLTHHRGVSHWLLVGTLTRVLWVILVLLGGLALARLLLGPGVPPADAVVVWLAQPALLAGWLLMDLVHLLLDLV